MDNRRLLVPVSGAVGIGVIFLGVYAWRRHVQVNRLATVPVQSLESYAASTHDWAPREAELLRDLHFLPR